MADFLRQLWALIRPHQRRLWLGVVAGLGYALGSGLLLLAVNLVIDAVFPSAGGLAAMLEKLKWLPDFLLQPLTQALNSVKVDPRSPQLLWIIALLPVAMLFRGIGLFLNQYYLHWVATYVVNDLRVKLFTHLQRLSLDYFRRTSTGDLVSRLTLDTAAIINVIIWSMATLSREPAAVIGIVGYLIFLQPKLTLLSMVVLPFVVIPILVFGRKVRSSWKAAQAATAELTSQMQESFTGIRVVKAFNLEDPLAARFEGTSRRIASQLMRLFRAAELPGPLIETFGACGVCLLLYYVARITDQKPSAGDFTAFLTALFSLYQPIKGLSRFWSFLEQGRAAGDRLFTLLDERPDHPEPAQPLPLNAKGAAIEFRDVNFSYADRPALSDFNLTIQPGQLVALVGASGSGKTTVTSLLLRFYDPASGSVRVGGHDLRAVHSSDLRAQVAVVTQETILFNDTIRNNLRYGRLNATDAETEAAARHAFADGFIRAKPGGYDEVIGERGVSLSGGERQRLAIARAVLRDAPILILDEATSALDSESERLVQTALEGLMRGRTTLCIAHRLSTIQKADLIVVMNGGRIVETGRHEELLARNGAYRRLHDIQFQA
jgi:subfamily B ATP-binding cassette protein MsbA